MALSNRKLAAALFAALLATVATVPAALAQQKLKFAHVYETNEPYHTWAVWAAGEIAKRTSNRYTMDVFPASALGKETDINQSLTLGTIDVIYTGQAFAARTFPPLAIGGAPYMFRDFDHWKKYSESAVLRDVMEGYFKKGGNKPLAVTYYGVRHTTANKPIMKPEDMKGLKLRVPDAPLYVMYPKVVGANATPIAFAEVYLALQNKTVDAQENPLPTIEAKKFYEVQSHINLTGHITEMLLTIVSGQLWAKLSDADKKAFEAVFREAASKATGEIAASEIKLVDEFATKYKKTVVKSDRGAFKKVFTPFHVGPDATWDKALYEKVQAIKYGSITRKADMATKKKKDPGLRSIQWFGRDDIYGFIYRSWMKNKGIPHDQFDGRPVIGICNTWSELVPCNSHFRVLAQHVRDGVLEAGGFPLEFPVMSLGETLLRPTAMLYRNLVSMDVEESIRANPLDGVVLLVGCDKTTPALLMGAASVDLPTVAVSGGPMLSGKYRGTDIGSGTNVWSMSEDLRAGKISQDEFHEAESCMHRSHGHCMTMGTASTMASMVESLGVGMPGNAAIPAVDARRYVLAREAGRRAVEMVREKMNLSKVLTRQAFENAIRVNAAIGGSTNAVIHLIAIARRIGIDLKLEDWDKFGRGIHTLVNLMPNGKYLMEDFYYAGGLPVVIRELGKNGKLHKEALTVNGKSIWQNNKAAPCYNRDVIHTFDKPFKKNTGIAVLRGNLCPDGAIIKPSAATPKLMKHKGRAVVFENIEDFHKRIDDPKLDIDANCVMVLKNCGPRGYPGMAEVGNMPLPPKLLKKGVTDMVRVSDARMSGTAYGTVVLHSAPEAAAGGALALVENGDMIELDVANRRLELLVPEAELAKRRKKWKAPKPPLTRGYWKLYNDHVLQANEGADLDFLVGKSGALVPRDNH